MASTNPGSAADERHLANVLGAVTLDLQTRIEQAVEDAAPVSIVQATALSALANYADGGSTEQLREAVRLSHSATVRLVDRLSDLGYVERGRTDVDQRVSAVRLTRAGRDLVGVIRAARNAVLRGWVRRLSADQRRVLSGVLDEQAAYGIAPAPDGVETADYVCRLCDARACGHPSHCPVTQAVRASGD